MMKERITILVRAIPEESKKYGHTVCVAGITDSNEWRRLYPFRFRYGKTGLDFVKKDVIEAEVERNAKDARKESRKVLSHANLFSALSDDDISARLDALLDTISGMESKGNSLCVVRPRIKDIDVEINDTNILDPQKYLSSLSGGLEMREKVKMPVEVRYVFSCGGECCKNKPHKIIVIDWEINELARNLLRRYGDKAVVEGKMRQKLFDWMITRNVYFIMGTHFRFKTPMIIGIFYPQKHVSAKLPFQKYSSVQLFQYLELLSDITLDIMVTDELSAERMKRAYVHLSRLWT